MKSRIVLAVLTAMLLFAPAAFSQTAQITGLVFDSTGAVIPGTAITVMNQDTGITTYANTNPT